MSIAQESLDQALDYMLPYIEKHSQSQSKPPTSRNLPFILALTRLQGSGKSTWAEAITKTLNEKHGYSAVNVSLDDFYLNHDALVRTRDENPSNALLRTRGQPGTHDTTLAHNFFDSLTDFSSDILVPSFDKSMFNGQGERRPKGEWRRIPAGTAVDILVFEGWCVGFQPLRTEAIRNLWRASHARHSSDEQYPVATLHTHPLQHILEVNRNLEAYCEAFMGPRYMDFLLHLDTDKLANVYRWRIQQENALRAAKHGAMADEEVVDFVRGYMPAYELYLDQLRNGFFESSELSSQKRTAKGQLRVTLDKERNVIAITMHKV